LAENKTKKTKNKKQWRAPSGSSAESEGLRLSIPVSDAMLVHGIPEYTRSDNGLEMTSKLVRGWLEQVGA
jgi:hypothetical protein